MTYFRPYRRRNVWANLVLIFVFAAGYGGWSIGRWLDIRYDQRWCMWPCAIVCGAAALALIGWGAGWGQYRRYEGPTDSTTLSEWDAQHPGQDTYDEPS